mmetsp:Transcript_21128/g.45873  ORF Transcript_21128/g.45873 Transcript_21128/m.45873 type:complete len:514 (+) Transcript_21128:48-1589(+)
MTMAKTSGGGDAAQCSSVKPDAPPAQLLSTAANLAASFNNQYPPVTSPLSAVKAPGPAAHALANISAEVKRAACIRRTKLSSQSIDSGKLNRGPVEPRDQQPSRKRFRAGDNEKETADREESKGKGDVELQPFTSLPFYGDHKRAISSLSFAPSSSISRGISGGVSLNSTSGQVVASVICASASADGCAKVWDITKNLTDVQDSDNSHTKKKKPTGAAHQSSFLGVATRLDPKLSLFGHNRGINDVAWSPTASYIATASDDKTLRLWSAETGDAFVEFRGHTNFVFSCKFNPQSNLLVSGSFDETVKLWDVRCGECVATLPAHSNPVTGVDFNRDGTCIVSGSYDGLVRIWDTATGECLKTVYAEGNPPVGGVRFSPNGRFVLSGTLDSKLRLYDVSGGHERGSFGNEYRGLHHRRQLRGGKCSKTYAGHDNTKFCAFAAFLSANPKRQCVVSGSEDGKVYLYDLQSRLVRQTLEGHHDAVLAVDAHDSLELIGSGGMSNDKFVRFWGPSKID